ncbi:MAG: PASTA domain-containing protein [Muribaculum sp.]|nr:PASTA domain-containing protein [Muribaculum sp.]
MEEKKSVKRPMDFIRRHPILFNLLLIILVGCGVVWMALIGLDIWTGHGKYEVVPNIKGMSYSQASSALEAAGLKAELSDSIYDADALPGTVLEQSPRANTKVKPNRTVYLTTTAFSPKMVTIPVLSDMSVRTAKSALEGIGIKDIVITHVPSEFKDLVIGARYDGQRLEPGTRIPITSTVILEVGEGIANDTDSLDLDDDSLDFDTEFSD